MGQHFDVKCKRCDKRMGGCRCMAKDKTIRWDVCGKCKDALAEEYLEAQGAKDKTGSGT